MPRPVNFALSAPFSPGVITACSGPFVLYFLLFQDPVHRVGLSWAWQKGTRAVQNASMAVNAAREASRARTEVDARIVGAIGFMGMWSRMCGIACDREVNVPPVGGTRKSGFERAELS